MGAYGAPQAPTKQCAVRRASVYWSPKGAIVAEAFAVLNGVGEADVPDEGASLGSTTAVGFGGTLGVAAGQATTTAMATTRAVTTPARAPRMSCIRPNMP
jgi:hypothetical protein